ncbi:unnamed protein product [Kuraishia capsulata CBS 1993]|uniref:beta-mannosidase n=1 Tax=Kuraishia capsulata CBS 1993 TaxID=1382522 RepID=W6MJ00_9ASCO|nr:uncharacterized protein KUCA_T00002142001 [Kuraishia capsulata CBS 1993]CDK26171.1 unnamed protein product [Kuraishia capsulata CBS 1993]
MPATKLSGWSFKAPKSTEWNDSSDMTKATCEIFPDLLAIGAIPNPFENMNELEVQWVGESDWEYRCFFEAAQYGEHELVFEGLDTFCDVYLNGVKILETQNMFLKYEVNITPHVKADTRNELRLYFHSALLKGRDMWEHLGRTGCSNGEGSRCWVRKAQYHYGWDWGPMLMSCGVYLPITLYSYNEKLTSAVETSLEGGLRVNVNAKGNGKLLAKISHYWKGKGLETDNLAFFELEPFSEGIYSREFTSSDFPFVLWYPNQMGEQNLYSLELVLVNNSYEVLDKKIHKFAFRKIELVEDEYKSESGSSFYFKVNGVPTFANGTNWIPAHSFLTQLKDEDYSAWLELAHASNQNIVRIWGGGIYEPEIFYEECDRLGIMVWQDFMFACGQYPGEANFIENVRKEVAYQIERLSKHPSLALFCGNNEDYQYAESHHLQWDKNDKSGNYFHTTFPGRGIYEVVIPDELKKANCEVAYHFGSPYGGSYTHDPAAGDTHMWQIWHGRKEEYQKADLLGARFISEFGMESFPSYETLKEYIEEPSLYPQSQIVEFHNKAKDSLPSLTKYMYNNVKVESDLEGFIFSNQIMQSECLTFALNLWRLRWKKVESKSGGTNYQNGGSIVWQLDDCWPVISWSIVDHLRRPKLSYYAVKRAFEKQKLITKRNGKQGWERFAPDSQDTADIEIWVSSTSETTETDLLYRYRVYEIATGKAVFESASTPIKAPANDIIKLQNVKIDHQKSKVVYFEVTSNGKIVTSAIDWPQPLKYVQYSTTPAISLAVNGDEVSVSTTHPVKCLELHCGDPKNVSYDDNGFDLVPGQSKKVKVKITESGPLQAKYRFYLEPQWN